MIHLLHGLRYWAIFESSIFSYCFSMLFGEEETGFCVLFLTTVSSWKRNSRVGRIGEGKATRVTVVVVAVIG